MSNKTIEVSAGGNSFVARYAYSIYKALAKISPFLMRLDFKSADLMAKETPITKEQTFFDTPEYQSARQDFAELDKIKELLNAFNFRTAKIEYDLHEVGCGGYAYQKIYQKMRESAVKSAIPALKDAISNSDYEAGRRIADELSKTSDFDTDSTYLQLVKVLNPAKHFLIDDESNCYYAPAEVELDSENLLEDSDDAFDVLISIAESDDVLEKFLAVAWILDVQALECLESFGSYDFLDSSWFDELLRHSINLPDTNTKQIIRSLLVAKMPKMARKVFSLAENPKLSEDDYYEAVAAAASELASTKGNDIATSDVDDADSEAPANQEIEDEDDASNDVDSDDETGEEGEYYDDLI